jgi:hypothetical protein
VRERAHLKAIELLALRQERLIRVPEAPQLRAPLARQARAAGRGQGPFGQVAVLEPALGLPRLSVGIPERPEAAGAALATGSFHAPGEAARSGVGPRLGEVRVAAGDQEHAEQGEELVQD